jgi:hypothetical protein
MAIGFPDTVNIYPIVGLYLHAHTPFNSETVQNCTGDIELKMSALAVDLEIWGQETQKFKLFLFP